MQATSDIFLGWTTSPHGEFYVRQLRDAKLSPMIETIDEAMFTLFAQACGWNLARAHAKTGDADGIRGYLGKSDKFDEAVASFAEAYADQAERDYAAFRAAVKAGKVQVYAENPTMAASHGTH